MRRERDGLERNIAEFQKVAGQMTEAFRALEERFRALERRLGSEDATVPRPTETRP
jgi:uncharacterized coiled-coil DUF342 family protein